MFQTLITSGKRESIRSKTINDEFVLERMDSRFLRPFILERMDSRFPRPFVLERMDSRFPRPFVLE